MLLTIRAARRLAEDFHSSTWTGPPAWRSRCRDSSSWSAPARGPTRSGADPWACTTSGASAAPSSCRCSSRSSGRRPAISPASRRGRRSTCSARTAAGFGSTLRSTGWSPGAGGWRRCSTWRASAAPQRACPAACSSGDAPPRTSCGSATWRASAAASRSRPTTAAAGRRGLVTDLLERALSRLSARRRARRHAAGLRAARHAQGRGGHRRREGGRGAGLGRPADGLRPRTVSRLHRAGARAATGWPASTGRSSTLGTWSGTRR